MTRTGSRKSVARWFGDSRLLIAEAYLKAATTVLESAADGDAGNPVLSLLVSAAIGFTDAVCAKYGGFVSDGEHTGAVKVLRDAIGNRLPKAQETRLRNVLTVKELAQYGNKVIPMREAVASLAAISDFAAWARQELRSVN